MPNLDVFEKQKIKNNLISQCWQRGYEFVFGILKNWKKKKNGFKHLWQKKGSTKPFFLIFVKTTFASTTPDF